MIDIKNAIAINAYTTTMPDPKIATADKTILMSA
jgi:hypothetical protein